MKKYLFNHYFLTGLFALFTVVGLESFKAKKESAKMAAVEDLIFFEVTQDELTNCNQAPLETIGTKMAPADCDEVKDYCCALGFNESDCTPAGTSGTEWTLNPGATPQVTLRYEEQP